MKVQWSFIKPVVSHGHSFVQDLNLIQRINICACIIFLKKHYLKKGVQ